MAFTFVLNRYSSNRLRTNATTVVDKSGAGQSSSASSYRTASPNPFAAPDYQPQQGRELEQQNDERLEGLSQKVRLLKDVSCVFIFETMK